MKSGLLLGLLLLVSSCASLPANEQSNGKLSAKAGGKTVRKGTLSPQGVSSIEESLEHSGPVSQSEDGLPVPRIGCQFIQD